MDRQDQTETRDPNKPAHRHGLRHALRRAAARRRAGLRSDVVRRLKRHGCQRALGVGKVDFYRSGAAMGPTMDHLALALWAYLKYSIICLMRIPDIRSQPRRGFGTVRPSSAP